MYAPAPGGYDPNGDRARTVEVATAFRGVLVWFGTAWITNIGFQMLAGAVAGPRGSENPLAAMLGIGGLGAYVVCAILMLVQVYRLTQAMGSSVAILWVLAMFVPCLNLIFLLVLNSQATSWLNIRGVKVGLLGPSPEVIEQLKRGG